MEHKRMVVGFLFERTRNRMVLIRKNRPSWQAGQYNGVGGHIEDGETSLQAMQREFQEEAGADVADWNRFATATGEHHGYSFEIDFYRAFSTEAYIKSVSQTDEPLNTFAVHSLPPNRVPNLRVLITMALDVDADMASHFEGIRMVAA